MKKRKWLGILLTFFATLGTAVVVVLATWAYACLSKDELERLTQLVGATAATLAALWFTIGLWLQRRQLEEQRDAFLESSSTQHEDSRRNTILFCKEILETTRQRILSKNNDLSELPDIIAYYSNVRDMNIVIMSDDPDEILRSGVIWIQKESAALDLLRNLAMTASMYFDATGVHYETFVEPDDFVAKNGHLLHQIPVFQEYCATSEILSQFMQKIKQFRSVATVAYALAVSLTSESNIIIIEGLYQELDKLKMNGNVYPEIYDKFSVKFPREK